MTDLAELILGEQRERTAPPAVAAVVASVSTADDLHVVIPEYDPQIRFGPCPFVGPLPERGDDCLVVFDDEREPWAIIPGLVTGGGEQGPPGPEGPEGPMGPAGPTGPKGDTGNTGAAGTQGPKGDTGATGATGAQGPQGVKGDTGAQGPKGDTGAQGPAGTVYDSDQVGTVKAFTGKTVPENWMLADGRTLNRVDYPQLADLYSIPAQQPTFVIPDLRAKFLYGASASNLSDILGTGGEASHVLTVAEMPSHNHGGLTGARDRSQAHNHYTGWLSVGGPATYQGVVTSAHTANEAYSGTTDPPDHLHGISAQGGNAAHNNLPPYVLVAYILKAKGVTINAGGALVGPPGPPGNSVSVPMDTWHIVGAAGEPALTAPWVNYGAPPWQAIGFRKDPLGRVYLKGLVGVAGTNGAQGSVIFTLPVGYRPPMTVMLDTSNVSSQCRLDVIADGRVIFNSPSTAPGSYIPLDHLSFDTESVSTMPVGPQGPPGPGIRGLVNTLPSLPVDGDECYYQNAAMAVDGIVWHLRYRASSPSPYKWESLGTERLYASVPTGQTVADSGAFVDLATVGPAVTLPLAGDYDLEGICEIVTGATNGFWGGLNVQIGATPASDVERSLVYTPAASQMYGTAHGTWRKTGVGAGVVAKLVYKAGGTTLFQYRRIWAKPIRVG